MERESAPGPGVPNTAWKDPSRKESFPPPPEGDLRFKGTEITQKKKGKGGRRDRRGKEDVRTELKRCYRPAPGSWDRFVLKRPRPAPAARGGPSEGGSEAPELTVGCKSHVLHDKKLNVA